MSVSRKVFIYTGKGASSESASDIAQFMRENVDIFGQKPDIAMGEYTFNPEGLKCPLFIVPGGSTSTIGSHLRPFFNDAIFPVLGLDFNYIGICAGSIIACRSADAFLTSTEFDPDAAATLIPGSYYGKFTTTNFCLDLVPVNAVGSFYPSSQVKVTSKLYEPYKVTLSCADGPQSNQLYVHSPGFDPASIPESIRIVATYADRGSYTFDFGRDNLGNRVTKTFSNFPAILSRKPDDNKGGCVLAGTHIEACVQNSQMMRFFKEPDRESAALTANEYSALGAEQEKTSVFVKDLFKTSLK